MTGYIDRKEVHRVLDELKVKTGIDKTIQDLKYMIDTIEDADVREVRHGLLNWQDNIEGYWLECSCCSFEFEYRYPNEFNYCPNCGAKIDEKSETK
ncbi:MAG: hypothetical protein NC452_05955 [Eubacterium sp.]|nr:hypothetical protein [Eubacterium sp.]